MVQGKYLDLAGLKPAPMDMAKCIYASVRRYLCNRMHRTQWCLRMRERDMSPMRLEDAISVTACTCLRMRGRDMSPMRL